MALYEKSLESSAEFFSTANCHTAKSCKVAFNVFPSYEESISRFELNHVINKILLPEKFGEG